LSYLNINKFPHDFINFRSNNNKSFIDWQPEITAQQMCAEMVAEDYKAARRMALLKQHGLDLPMSYES
jgi:hypothetical protein